MEVVSGTPEYHSSSKRPTRDTLVLAATFLCVFTSYQSLQTLQSSLNQEEGLGVASLACVYGMMFLVSFFTPAIIYHAGIKGTILMAWCGHVIYVAANFYPHWGVLIPGSLLLGAVSCPLWTSQKTYLSSLSRVVVEQDLNKSPKVVTTVHAAFSRLTGLFQGIFSFSEMTGNLLSSTIFFQSTYSRSEDLSSSSSSLTSESESMEGTTCGVTYCPQSGEGQHLEPPERHIVYILLGVFLALDCAGIVVTWCFVPNLEQPRYTGREVLRKLRSYWQALAQPKLWLLVPLFLAQGMIFAIHVGLFTEAFISCALGMRMVGYVMALWGLAVALSAMLLGYAAKYTGRRFLFSFAFVMEAAILVVFLLWRPHAGSTPVFLSLAAVMGLVDGVWSVQCMALIAVLFPAMVDSAFAVSGTWHSLAISASFLLAKFVCPARRIHMALGLLGAALLGYVLVEIAHWRSLKSFDRGDHQYMLLATERETNAGAGSEGTIAEGEVEEGEGEGLLLQQEEGETELNGEVKGH